METERTKLRISQISKFANYDELVNENNFENKEDEPDEPVFDRFERLWRLHCQTAIRSIKLMDSELISAQGMSIISTALDGLDDRSVQDFPPTEFGAKVSKHLIHNIYFMDVWKSESRNVSLLVGAGANTTLLAIDKGSGMYQTQVSTSWIKGICVWNSFVIVCGINSTVKVYKICLKEEEEHKKELEEFSKTMVPEPPSSWGFRKDITPAPPSLVEKLECVAEFASVCIDSLMALEDQIWIGGGNTIDVFKGKIGENDIPTFERQFQLKFNDGIAKACCAWKDVVASASWNVHLWNPKTGEHVRVLPHKLPVQCLAVWGSLLATGSDDHMIRLWNLKYEPIAEMKGHTGYIRGFCVYKDTLLSTADDQSICSWEDRFSWKHVRVLFIGWKKNLPSECPIAMLPKDLFNFILHDIYSNNGQQYRIFYDDFTFDDSDSGYA